VIQGGDPEGSSSGGPGYSVVEKLYVVTGADAGLPPEYALVGKVSEGMDVVERIGSLGTPAEKPKQTILIESITIEKG
jgi:cyclophilin family peptidyl-prolyl cis-trans isomerase